MTDASLPVMPLPGMRRMRSTYDGQSTSAG
jgi:hypothetical protein